MLENDPPKRSEGQLRGRLKRAAGRILRAGAPDIHVPTVDGVEAAIEVLQYEGLVKQLDHQSTDRELEEIAAPQGLIHQPRARVRLQAR